MFIFAILLLDLKMLSFYIYVFDFRPFFLFSVAGPCLWNSLPVTLRDRDISLLQFKRLLKTLWFV